jgi:hypothetical protein
MKQNKRFILLVVMVLLANCLFAGLASAAWHDTFVSAIYAPQKAQFAYDRTAVDPYGNFYGDGTYGNIWLNLSRVTSPTAGYYNDWLNGGDIDAFYMHNDRTETGNNIAFLVTSSDASVLAVNGNGVCYVGDDYDADGNYLGTGGSIALIPKKLGEAVITITAGVVVERGYGTAVQYTGVSTSFPVKLVQDTASQVILVKKPIAQNYKVGDSITAGLASTKIAANVLKYDLSQFTHDIEAFVTFKGYDYVWATTGDGKWVSVPVKLDSQGNVLEWKEVWVAEYSYTGAIQYRFDDLVWSASPADAAKITADASSAKIEFLKAGTVTITAALKGDPSVKASVSYTVAVNPDMPVETLKLQTADGKTSATVKLIKGETPATLTLSAKDKDGKAVEIYKFKSSNTKVATIDEKTGVVTVKGEGTVQMTGTTKAGDTYYFNLKVKKVPVSKLTVTTKSIKVEVGKTAQIAWATKPAYAYNPAVKFKSSDKKIATVSDTGLVTGVKAGKTTVVVTPKFAKDTVNPVTIKVTVK